MRRLGVLVALTAATVLLAPPTIASAQGILTSLRLSATTVRDGGTVTGTVTLSPDPAEASTVLLFSSDPTVAAVPASVVAPAGESTVTFTISTNAAAPGTIVQIRAAIGFLIQSANLSVNPAPPPGPSLAAVSATPSTLTGGSAATGTVTFTGATDGAIVQLESGDPSLVQVPAQALVAGNAAAGTFAVATSAVATTTTVTITADWFGITRSTTLTLTPGAPAPADQVAVTKARWKARLLTIEATSTNPNAILSVFGQSGGFMFNLTNQGGGRYSDQRGWLDNPLLITVRSNLGGSATARVANG
jgi:hypothetical protein